MCFLGDLVGVVLDCFLNCLDNDCFVLLTTSLQGKKLFVELIFFIDCTVQFMTDLAV